MNISHTGNWDLRMFEAISSQVQAHLEKFVARFAKDETAWHIMHEVMEGKKQLWTVSDGYSLCVAIVITEIFTVDATGRKGMRICTISGEKGVKAAPLLARIEAWAKDQGVDFIESEGRHGWSKLAAAHGYREKSRVYRKELNDGRH